MSRKYEMEIEVTQYQPTKAHVIEEALRHEWFFSSLTGPDFIFEPHADRIVGIKTGLLERGETVQDFVRRMHGRVCIANGRGCTVRVISKYLDDPPMGVHTLTASGWDAPTLPEGPK